jgi:alkanesulfonate monooxygenase SsuD/methylene tetrahydromethanopterin reductase-like flavin-dependent oxidoreductase (luciferase family)
LKHGIFIPNFGPFGDPHILVELAVEAERSGWDGLFLWDHISLEGERTGGIVDPWITLAAIATATSRIRLGTLVTPTPRRRPWKLAREASTLDHLSRGRLVLGVGLGFPAEQEFAPFGEEVDDRERAKALDEGLAILDGLWSGEEFSFSGDHHTVKSVRFLPRPVQRPRVPIWCAGWWPNKKPFRRAARWDGIAPEMRGGATPAPSDVEQIHAYVARHRTDGGDFDLVVNGRAEEHGSMYDFENAGATWWLERFDRKPAFSRAGALERILAGPPS